MLPHAHTHTTCAGGLLRSTQVTIPLCSNELHSFRSRRNNLLARFDLISLKTSTNDEATDMSKVKTYQIERNGVQKNNVDCKLIVMLRPGFNTRIKQINNGTHFVITITE